MMLLALIAAAISSQNIAALDRAVAAFTGRPVGAEGGARAAIDPRLRLAPCATVALSWRTPAQDAVVASCSEPDWRIFVQVNRTAPVGPAAVPTSGRVAVTAIKAPPVIRRGDPVMIEAGAPGFSVTREGVAMGDAAAGARLLIRVADARAPVQAVAVAVGRAALPGTEVADAQ